MSVEVRPARREDVIGTLRPVFHYFGREPTKENADRFARVLDPQRMHAAWEDGEIVGGAGAFDFRLTIPGNTVPAAGVTVVGVLPTHRRRGVLTQLMRAQLDDIHERGEALAALWASEGGIYGRFGYGLAALCGEIDLLRVYSRFHRAIEPRGEFRLLSQDEALESLPPVYERVAVETPGMFTRSRDWWAARVLDDAEWRRDGGGEMVRVMLERDGERLGYALYRLRMGFADGGSTGSVEVLEAMGSSPEATAAIWRHLFDIDWMERTKARLLPVDHPLFLLLEEPSRMRFRVEDSLWLRLVDVSAALAARAWAGEGDLVLAVTDSYCPWNEGSWRLDGSQTGDSPELRLDVSDLASAYLGGFTFAQRLRSGRVDELAEGAVARADALFRTDRAPWCPEIF
jgi:predicted acetyltransferase